MKSPKLHHIIQLSFALVIVALAVFISAHIFFRIDLTSEKRFTISDETKTILKKLDDVVYVKVYLEGDLPYGFKKLRNGIRETLDEFRVYGVENIQYEFINPSESSDVKIRNKTYSELVEKGVTPTNIQSHDKEGSASEKLVFPGAIISYKGVEVSVGFLKNNPTLSAEENLNNSMQTVEYELIKVIYTISNPTASKVAFLEGHGELNEMETSDITRELANYYQVDRGAIKGHPEILKAYKAIIVARPTQPFSEQDKLAIDQYIMNGGKVIWFVNEVDVNIDSLANGFTLGTLNRANIEDQLFTYGVRVNPNLVQDVQCNVIPVNTAIAGAQAKWTPAPWLYYLTISPLVEHPVTRGLNLILARYASQIDTVGVGGKVRKTVLLKSSSFTRLVKAPLRIGLEEIKQAPSRNEFNKSNQPIAVLLEGQFTSLYRNRMVNNILPGSQATYKAESVPNKMIVVADGELIANDVRITAKGPMISALGYDKFTHRTFGNKEFVVNAVNYLADESGLITLRAKEFKLRVLDKAKVREERLKWQLINTVLPIALVALFGVLYFWWRKRKYAR